MPEYIPVIVNGRYQYVTSEEAAQLMALAAAKDRAAQAPANIAPPNDPSPERIRDESGRFATVLNHQVPVDGNTIVTPAAHSFEADIRSLRKDMAKLRFDTDRLLQENMAQDVQLRNLVTMMLPFAKLPDEVKDLQEQIRILRGIAGAVEAPPGSLPDIELETFEDRTV